ncbi:MAG TPA: Asp-tRNA(Asn)/Glu-tRNA(Gln) amidotransferase subunit GatA [Phycisphaerae bacterium]|nr:Asp-tRNA(Asn)/Glu-tRNA(Gln) amidotransferase subunit GatA [Phycisphaerae bacterium]
MDLSKSTAHQLKSLIAGGETTCREVMLSVLEEIERRESDVQAFITVRDRGELLAEADEVDRRRSRGDAIGALAGLPIAVKDNICTQGMATTCASRMLADWVPPYDATVVQRIQAADGIILGKTNLDEFAMGSSTENSAMKTTRNPHNHDYVPGGTSGGSAAAVASNECILAIGSDTGGSIRQPASFCGVVGMKPTYGRVSRYGLIAYASSLDQIGPIAKDVRDAALLLEVIAGHDPMDSTSLAAGVPGYVAGLGSQRGFRFGVPDEYFGPGVDRQVRRAVEGAIDALKEDGQEVVQISLPHTEYSVAAYYIAACSEASSNLARYDGCQYGFRAEGIGDMIGMVSETRAEGFGPEVKRRIMLGTYALSAGYYDAYYLKAARVRRLIAQDFESAFKTCDVILHPVAPTAAFRIGEKIDDPLAMYLGDIFSVTANLAGLPATSVPCGRTSEGLPVGIQLTGKALDEGTLLAAAYHLECLLRSSAA